MTFTSIHGRREEESLRAETMEFSTPMGSRGASASFRLRNGSLNSLRLRRIFDLFDANHDEEITVDELLAALGRLGLDVDPLELSSHVESFLKPGRSGLDFEDFERFHRSVGDTFLEERVPPQVEEEVEDEDLNEAFKVFDVDGDGYISARELQEVLGKLGFTEGRDIWQVEGMIDKFDSNCDGKVDFGEFKHMMRSFSLKNACA